MGQEAGQVEAGDILLDALGRQHDAAVVPKAHEIRMAFFDIQVGGRQSPLGQQEQPLQPRSHKLGNDFRKQPPALGRRKSHGKKKPCAGHAQEFFRRHLLRRVQFIHNDVRMSVGKGFGHGIEGIARRGDGKPHIEQRMFRQGDLGKNHPRQGAPHDHERIARIVRTASGLRGNGRRCRGRSGIGRLIGRGKRVDDRRGPFPTLGAGPFHSVRVDPKQIRVFQDRVRESPNEAVLIPRPVERQAGSDQGVEDGGNRHQV